MSTAKRNMTIVTVLILMLMAPIAAIVPTAMADETVPPDLPSVTRQEVLDSVIKGLDWYAANQNFDGSWTGSVGVTGFVVICFTGAGYDYTNTTVQNALRYMRNFYNSDDGTLADTYQTYETSISLIAMAAAGDPEDADKLPKMAGLLERLQFSPGSVYEMTEPWYLGGWPNYAGIPDLSNSQFAILALMSAQLLIEDYTVADNVWANSTVHTSSAQNWPDVNDLSWAHNITLPSHRDGGFVYNGFRSRTPLGEQMFESYGSITAAGYFSYLVAGNDQRQPEVASARSWLDYEYNLEINPRMVGKGLYYYLWSQTRALSMSGQDWVVDSSGKLHDWRAEVADLFMDRQEPNGGWPGNPQTGWREEEPEVMGIYAILSMQAAYLMAPNPELIISVHTQKDVTFIDVEGNVLVSDASRGLTVRENFLECTDPDLFRKVWLQVPSDPSDRDIVVRGTWGEGRVAERTLSIGPSPATVNVATGGFAGPFGIHVTVLDNAPAFEVDKKKVEVVRGETSIIDFELTETTGDGPITRAMLITEGRSGLVADATVQGIDVPAGDVDVLRLTIYVPEDVNANDDMHFIITSSTAPPTRIEVDIVESQDQEAAIGLFYWMLIILLVVIVFFFLLLPQVAKRKAETEEGLGSKDDDEPGAGPVSEPIGGPEVDEGKD
jgi:squalene-hopene/tetraprenyl-beta-curcumene cyclase